MLYQCFPPEEFKYGLRILQQSPESHDDAFFQYFWEVRDVAVDALAHANRTLTLAPRGAVHQLPFLELLVHLHSKPKTFNNRSVGWLVVTESLNAGSNAALMCLRSHVTLLTHLIQSPELNSSNPAPVVKDTEQRILRCYFRDLCRLYLSA